MEVYTLKQAARKAKIGVETLKRACEEGMIKATKLPNNQWRIVDEAFICRVARRAVIPICTKASRKATAARRTQKSPGSQAKSGKERINYSVVSNGRGAIHAPLLRS